MSAVTAHAGRYALDVKAAAEVADLFAVALETMLADDN
jgi:hypothetical protein